MDKENSNIVNNRNPDNSGESNNIASNDETVPPEERREKVLSFIAKHDMALPPLAIYAGLIRQEGITFGYRTVQNALSDLVEDGAVIRVDTESLRKDGTIKPVEDSSRRRAYYFITDKGREWISE